MTCFTHTFKELIEVRRMFGLDELTECQTREWPLFSGRSGKVPERGQCVQRHAIETQL